MNKFVFAFLKSHLKKAIYELKVANKIEPNVVDEKLIKELELVLIDQTVKREKEKEGYID